MLQTRKQITINGASVIEENGEEIVVMTLFASLSESGKLNINTTVANKEKYAEYADDVNADMQAFNLEALKLVQEA